MSETVKMKFVKRGCYPSVQGWTDSEGHFQSKRLEEGDVLELPKDLLAYPWWEPVKAEDKPAPAAASEPVKDKALTMMDDPEQISNEEALQLSGVSTQEKKEADK